MNMSSQTLWQLKDYNIYRCVLHMSMLKSLLQIHLHCELCVHNVNVHMQVYIVSSDNFRDYAGPSFTF
jgi:hypothetical protein